MDNSFHVTQTKVLVPQVAGFGAQYNQNVYAAISRKEGVTDQNVGDMEQKLLELRPQFVRVFFNPSAFSDADLMKSFERTIQLAQRTATSINVTWQGGGTDSPKESMAQFASLLTDLATNQGASKLRWVTIQNEPNSTRITMELYESLYRLLDTNLERKVRSQIRFMGGDLLGTTSPLGQTQQDWFHFMGQKMADLLDAYSIHVYWDYSDTPKLVRRLTEVKAIRDALSTGAQKPLYVTEFGVRGIRERDGERFPEPGIYEDGTPFEQTNINAFQHAWFALLAVKLGYYGVVKWDAHFGKYDRGTQDYTMIGGPREGWPLRPVYRLMRLLTTTVGPGWTAVGVDGPAGTRLVAGFTTPYGELTLIGLDTDGASLNTVSSKRSSYSLTGLPPKTAFQLRYWNRDGKSTNMSAGRLQTDAAGVVTVTAPLHSVFALTRLMD
jgi:hypothetical protein